MSVAMEIENKIFTGDCLAVLKTFPDKSVDCCVTSPPYYNLRDYGNQPGQIGVEETPQTYLDRLVLVFQEVYRILKNTGTVWVNLGDSYNGSTKNNGGRNDFGNSKQTTNVSSWKTRQTIVKDLPYKSLLGIPWRFALAMQNNGWILSQDIIWGPIKSEVRKQGSIEKASPCPVK